MTPEIRPRLVRKPYFRRGKLEIRVDGEIVEQPTVSKNGNYIVTNSEVIDKKERYSSVRGLKVGAAVAFQEAYPGKRVEVSYTPNGLRNHQE